MPDSFHLRTAIVAACFLLSTVDGGQAHADDWPQWRGPRRDAVSTEAGLLSEWPAGGPDVDWHTPGLGTGYSSVVVGGGRVFTMGRQDAAVVVTALAEATGKPLWSRKIGETSRNPCSTPTLDGELVYALDPDGDLVCLNAMTGEVVWQVNFIDQFAGRMMSGRGYGESPLIDGQRLICTPGGEEAMLVALDKLTGQVIWKAKHPPLGPGGRDGAAFSSIVVTEAAGVRQYVQLVGRGLVGLDARDGRFLWSYNAIANDTANIPTPVVHNEHVFAANGYTAGSVLLKLVPDKDSPGTGPGVKPEVVYSLPASQFQNHHGGVLRLGDYLFAGHGNNNGLPTCLEFKTGRIAWKRRGPGVGSAAVISANGQLCFRYQNGVVALIDATERGYNLKGTFEVPGAGGDSWAHPVIANGRLYLREQDVLWTYDIGTKADGNATVASTKPPPASSAALTALRQLGIPVEPLSISAISDAPDATSNKGRRIYRYALESAQNPSAPAPMLVSITAAQLSPEYTLPEKLVALLKELPGPLVVSLAGTSICDAGLGQLQPLNVVGLNLELCPGVTDSGMKQLRQIKSLRLLVLAGTGITHVGLRHLASHIELLALDLELCDGITDDACEPLGEMRQLRSLVLKKSGFEKERISDAGLARLQNLSRLEVLNLYGNKVTNAGLAHLQPLKNLQELNLSLLAITDDGLAHLKPLTTLQHLELVYSEGFAGPLLTDRTAEFLLPLTNLMALDLTGAKLTDAGLERLRVLKKLKLLQLARTPVTSQGIAAFETTMPGCKVIK